MRYAKGCLFAPLILPLICVAFMVGGLVVQWLWNATVTEIFDTNPVTFWQSVLLIVLCKILFSNNYNVKNTKTNTSKWDWDHHGKERSKWDWS
jgi:hypothetical protein